MTGGEFPCNTHSASPTLKEFEQRLIDFIRHGGRNKRNSSNRLVREMAMIFDCPAHAIAMFPMLEISHYSALTCSLLSPGGMVF